MNDDVRPGISETLKLLFGVDFSLTTGEATSPTSITQSFVESDILKRVYDATVTVDGGVVKASGDYDGGGGTTCKERIQNIYSGLDCTIS